jgi:hypothetical protein
VTESEQTQPGKPQGDAPAPTGPRGGESGVGEPALGGGADDLGGGGDLGGDPIGRDEDAEPDENRP